jgi:hypothetical protein
MMKCPFFAGGYYKVIESSDKKELEKGIKATKKKVRGTKDKKQAKKQKRLRK